MEPLRIGAIDNRLARSGALIFRPADVARARRTENDIIIDWRDGASTVLPASDWPQLCAALGVDPAAPPLGVGPAIARPDAEAPRPDAEAHAEPPREPRVGDAVFYRNGDGIARPGVIVWLRPDGKAEVRVAFGDYQATVVGVPHDARCGWSYPGEGAADA